MGIAALVLGIVGVVTCCTLVPGILAIIFGIIGRKRAQVGEATNGGMALAGLILGIVAVATAVMWWIAQALGSFASLMNPSGIV